VISLVAGSRLICRLGWSLDLSCRPVEVFYFGGIVWRFYCIVRSPFVVGYPLVFF